MLFRSLPPDAVVMGEGVPRFRPMIESLSRRVAPESLFRARAETVYCLGHQMASRGQWATAEALTPFYIRKPEAEERWDARHGSSAASA